MTNGLSNNDALLQPKKEVVEEGDGKQGNTELDIFSTAGLKPSLADLGNMFEDSDNDMGCVPPRQQACNRTLPLTRTSTRRW